MPARIDSVLDQLHRLAAEASLNARVPFSGQAEACVLLLSDGSWIPGVRVESASFSLTIPAVLNALTTAAALQRSDIHAIVQNMPFRREDRAFLSSTLNVGVGEVRACAVVDAELSTLPPVTEKLSPFLNEAPPSSPADGITLARSTATRAVVQESDFHVGAVAVSNAGELIPGVNVEFSDWSRILCAERNALSTALSYGIPSIRTLYLTCLCDSNCTPCGACRQLLMELAPELELWIDRGERSPQSVRPEQLLPGFFSGESIPTHR